MKKTLVTGAPGFIGGHVTRLLVEQGRAVRAMALPGERLDNLKGLDVEVVRADLLDEGSLRRALDGVDRVFHLAAIYAIWLRDPALMYRVNVDGTRRLLTLALKAGVERVVFTSSIAALGVEPGLQPATEETPFNQWSQANDYILSKYISELEVRELARQGLPVVIVNPAFPYGRGDLAPTPTGQVIQNVLAGRYPGFIEGGFNAVDVEDVARGHLLAEEKGLVGERYLLCGTNISIKEFIGLVAEVAGTRPARRELPVSVMAAAGRICELWSDVVSRKTPLMTEKTVRYASQYLYYDNAKAVRVLGLPQTPIRRTIEKAVAWFRSDDFKKAAD